MSKKQMVSLMHCDDGCQRVGNRNIISAFGNKVQKFHFCNLTVSLNETFHAQKRRRVNHLTTTCHRR